MSTKKSPCLAALFLFIACGVRAALASATVTFTSDEYGTYPKSLNFDRTTQVLTADVSALPKDATIFRAELVLNAAGRFDQAQLQPTTVFPVGQPESKLEFVAPRYISLDALSAVRTAVGAGEPLRLKLESTLRGVERLEVSFISPNFRFVNQQAGSMSVGNVRVLHRQGQSFVLFDEPRLGEFPDFRTGQEVADYRTSFLKKHPGVTFRIWRSSEPIDKNAIASAKLVGQCGFFTAWNDRYWQGDTPKRKPVRYRVRDGDTAVEWGTGVYAHDPAAPGKAYSAVTVARDGQEDFNTLSGASCTSAPVEEQVGVGEPILQWIERPEAEKGWQYRRGEIVRLIYTRWESWPHSSTPSDPIDYLVVIPLSPQPKGESREPQYRAWRTEPAPVGLHLHCWGGSCNGGYGWWYNAHRGAVLIASNQIPYDWWTGHHDSRGTCKTWGDGHVRPFTVDRTFGFLDWAAMQWKDAPSEVREYWPKLDFKRVFTAGNSMGGSGAPMFAIRHSDRIAWGLGWVGVHVPELSPNFANSYRDSYGPRDESITMPDGKTSPWDFYSDVWWLRNHLGAETGMVIASNGKNDGGIGWKQAYQFARALQETRRPHIFNWGMDGHGTRTVIGSNFDLDVRTDQSLPAFTNCSLDDDIGDGNPETGKPIGQYNAHLWWQTDDIVDTPDAWEMTVLLRDGAPSEHCTVDITPRRCQRFRPKPDQELTWTNTSVASGEVIASAKVTVDQWGLVTLPGVTVTKSANRLAIGRIEQSGK